MRAIRRPSVWTSMPQFSLHRMQAVGCHSGAMAISSRLLRGGHHHSIGSFGSIMGCAVFSLRGGPMADTTDALLKWQIAVSCFAAQRMLSVLPLSRREPLRSMQELFYETGEAAKKDFRTNTWLFGSFQFGDKAQSALADLVSDTIRLKVLNPGYMMDVVSDLFRESTDAVATVGSTDGLGRLTEQFQNMRDVLGFVNDVDAPEELAADGTYPLAEKLEKFYARGDYPALWLVEGLGERFARARSKKNRDVRDLFTSGEGAALPAKARLMMHAGMGIAFAKDAIDELTPWSSERTVKDALKGFLQRIARNSMPGYEGAALESLGLVTHTWYAQLVRLVSDQLLALDADAGEFFWHGAGRSMYFSPMHMLPGLSPWEAADHEPPDETARRNARAGVAWAFTIVNVRQPEITAHFLRHRTDSISSNDAYTNGVHSTLVMAGEMVPGHKDVSEFCRFRPDADDSGLVSAWNTYIGRDAGDKIDQYRRSLEADGQLGEVFRYHDLSQFVADLAL
jgi:hypothetical protein